MARFLVCLTVNETQIPNVKIFDVKRADCDEFSTPDFTVVYMVVESDSKESVAEAFLNIKLNSFVSLSEFNFANKIQIVDKKIYFVGKETMFNKIKVIRNSFALIPYDPDYFKQKGLNIIVVDD